ncbi:MAG: DUF3883 domain-containing protein [Chlamydiales bacterium]|nr:DUF3883 domain-containing protein [Chlamydiales bacterium]
MVSTFNSSSQKEHIESLYNQRVDDPLWCKDMANVANFAEGCLFGRFLNELLQNADDAGACRLVFRLEKNILHIAHDGKHFDKEDVERIVSFANQEFQSKSTNRKVTGYKGIGFKALLSLASKVHIFSGGYSFCFDKSHWAKHPHRMPWQMIPIWTDPPDNPVSNLVTFVFQLNKPEDIENQFDNFLQEPRSALFLRNIKVIAFPDSHSQHNVERKDEGQKRILSGKSKTEWLVYDATIPIKKSLHEEIQELNTTICPDRIKDNMEINLSIAFFVENGKLQEHPQYKDLELYNLLPTKVRLGFPFAVNTAFLLEAQREQLVENSFNYYLIEKIAELHFSFLVQFAKEAHWQSVLHGLAPSKITALSKPFCDAYRLGFERGLKNANWIPSFYDSQKLMKVRDCYVDSTGFYKAFRDEPAITSTRSNLAHPDLEKPSKLQSLLREFHKNNILKDSDIIGEIEGIFKNNCDSKLVYDVLMFFKNRSARVGDLFIWEQLKDVPFVPSKGGQKKKLSELSLSSGEEKNKPHPPEFLDVVVIDPEIFSHDEDRALTRWLCYMGISFLVPGQIVRGNISRFIKNKGVTADNCIELTRYIYELFEHDLINEYDLKCLQDFPVLTKTGQLRSINTTFLSKDYGFHLEDLLPQAPDFFVSSNYIEPGRRVRKWEALFCTLGIKNKYEFSTENATIAELREKGIVQLDRYFDYLNEPPHAIIGRSLMSSDKFSNFVVFPFMDQLQHSAEFSRLFWTKLGRWNEWGRFMESDQSCTLKHSKKGVKPLPKQKDSYIKYMLNKYPSVKGTDGKFYSPKELYSPKLKTSNFPQLVCADIKLDLSEELIKYLGFKTQVNLKECHDFLEDMRSQNHHNMGFYKFLIEQLILNWPAASTEDKNKDWFFLAYNNDWKRVKQLDYFAVKDMAPSLHSDRWFKNVLDKEGMKEFAKIFNRPVVSQCVDLEKIEGLQEDTQCREKLVTRLPLIAWVYAHFNTLQAKDALKNLSEKLRRLHFYKAARIPSTIEGTAPISVAQVKNSLYYTEKCTKYLLTKKIVSLFGFSGEMAQEFIEIFHLKDARSSRNGKTEQDWISEKGISKNELKALKNLLNELDYTPIKDECSDQELSLLAQNTKPLARTVSDNPQDNFDTGPLLSGSSAASRKPLKDSSGLTGRIANLRIGRDQSTNNQSAHVPVSQIRSSGQLIKPLHIQKCNSPANQVAYGPGNQVNSASNTPSRSKITVAAKQEIGIWGEAFAFKRLKEHFEAKYAPSKFIKDSSRKDQLEAKNGTKISLEWLNENEESGQPYDIVLTKIKPHSNPKAYPVEIKATKDNNVHFSITDSEWKKIDDDANYRLYLVLQATTDHAELYKIPTPTKGWLQNSDVTVKKKYKVSAAKL